MCLLVGTMTETQSVVMLKAKRELYEFTAIFKINMCAFYDHSYIRTKWDGQTDGLRCIALYTVVALHGYINSCMILLLDLLCCVYYR